MGPNVLHSGNMAAAVNVLVSSILTDAGTATAVAAAGCTAWTCVVYFIGLQYSSRPDASALCFRPHTMHIQERAFISFYEFFF